jgi:DNA polymerase (family 10)
MQQNKTTLIHNKELARIFRQMSDCYSYLGPEQRFRAIAYDTASKTLTNMQEPVDTLADNIKKLDELKGIGESIAEKIIEYLHTGKIKTFEKLKKQVPFSLLELLDIEGIGPSTLRMVHEKLNIGTKEELIQALEAGILEKVKGFAAKKNDNLKKALKLDTVKQRMPLKEAEKIGNEIMNEIKKISGIQQCVLAGSLRRKNETVGDIDILVTTDEKLRKRVINKITQLPQVAKILASGNTKTSLISKNKNIQVDIRIVHEHEFGAALLYFTGNKEHNIQLRTIAKQKGWKVNEYGVFEEKSGKRLAGRTEEEIYSLFGLKYIPPEERLGRDELIKAKLN